MRALDRLGADRLGRLVLGMAFICFGVENLLFGRYVIARVAPWPDGPGIRYLVAFLTGMLFIFTGWAFILNQRVRSLGLTAALLVAGWSAVRHLPIALAGPAWSGDWTNVLKAATLAAGALGVAVADGRSSSGFLLGLRTVAPYAVGGFFVLCGIQHFLFAQFVATLIPPFIPGALFWTYAAGLALIAAGLGFWLPPARRLAATLTALMVFSWVFLVHLPLVFRVGRAEWMGVFEALGISGVCLALAVWPHGQTLRPGTQAAIAGLPGDRPLT
jgi:uncharacterized membrane protein